MQWLEGFITCFATEILLTFILFNICMCDLFCITESNIANYDYYECETSLTEFQTNIETVSLKTVRSLVSK